MIFKSKPLKIIIIGYLLYPTLAIRDDDPGPMITGMSGIGTGKPKLSLAAHCQWQRSGSGPSPGPGLPGLGSSQTQLSICSVKLAVAAALFAVKRREA